MSTPQLVAPKFVNMKNHPTLNEKWLQERLIENPSLLGLPGDLDIRDRERRQPSGGRLDLLLQDQGPEPPKRYEVEIQLGAVDESHIIRTIEYWDIERRRYPQYDHIAVIVAEDVTSRFLNVISLLNRAIPLIAIQIRGVEVNGSFTLIATRVVDLTTLGTEEEEEGDTVDRAYWEKKASRNSLQIMDSLVELINTVQPGLVPKYNKHYIGLASNGVARNFVAFRPQKANTLTEFKIPLDEDLTEQLEGAGLSVLSYSTRYRQYRLSVRKTDVDNHREVLLQLVQKAHDSYGAL